MKIFLVNDEPKPTRWPYGVVIVVILLTAIGSIVIRKENIENSVTIHRTVQPVEQSVVVEENNDIERATTTKQNVVVWYDKAKEHVPLAQIRQESLLTLNLKAIKPQKPPDENQKVEDRFATDIVTDRMVERAMEIAARPRAKVLGYSSAPKQNISKPLLDVVDSHIEKVLRLDYISPSTRYEPQGHSSIGYTPMGFPLNVGPRGGIFHYSKNGNKVYHQH